MIIGKNTRGLKVRKLQYRLGIATDGVFGSGTESEVKKWQHQQGLTVDGEMAEEDWRAMFGCSIDEWTPIGIVVHSMSEYIQPDDKIYRARDWLIHKGYSVHDFIHTDGKIERMKLTNEKALHAGVSKHNGLVGLNKYFLGYEILLEGNNNIYEFWEKIEQDGCYTKKQYDVAVMLTRVWMEEYNIPVKDVVRHSDVSGPDVRPDDPKKDPGAGFPWSKFIEDITKP